MSQILIIEDLSQSLCHPASHDVVSNVGGSAIEGRGETSYNVIWNGTHQTGNPLSSSIYYAWLKAGSQSAVTKLLLK